ncbi:hydrogenase maturation nickel metallochaperone HypA [Aminipila luticellarii]|uniref:Hydrogenase maturation factor HypA n=1 Tax=Aminipila luticellarii TaxID=2507160 RepID=A0A410PUR2_9FIRM|nr:hydrogenase maturation nickel metallochaperone HypA [Aminipila luticellarii]QAT42682.1 hydrogenase maturation nickel metallochaperone HypA [Aminipila luticellarii]
MHEYPITKRIIEISEKFAKENHAQEVKQINLVVGEYSGYVASSIELYFEIIAEDSICKNASLHIERVKPKLKCDSCGKLFERKPFSFECPYCRGEGRPTEIGQEFYIKSIEV